ncbi:MAG: hypothetical protein IPM17_07670 [Verrucomicrobia bacterium]|nr:hypothetical protein [Verrucomicrobiota bacterium]
MTTSILCGIGVSVYSEDVARVTGDRVNVRGGPSVDTEVITHLRRGEQVTVVEWGQPAGTPGGATSQWAKIHLPADTPVWVYAPFVDARRQVVRSDRLNVRAGPGLNFSTLGSLSKEAPIRRIRTLDDWMEIEAPTNTFAFVSAQYLQRLPPGSAAPSTPAVVSRPAMAPAAATAAASPEAVTAASAAPALAAAGPVSSPPAPAEPEAVPAPASDTMAPADLPPAIPPEPRRRIVRREGLVRPTISIQAPTPYELRSIYGAIRLNFLLPASPDIKIAKFRGQRVIVAGEEQIEPRWPNLPMIEVQSIRLAP